MPEGNVSTGTTATPADGSAQATGTTDKGTAGGSATETPEQRVTKLEAEKKELERKNQQMLSEKTAVEAERKRLEEEKRRVASQPPAATPTSLQDTSLAELESLAAQFPDNPVVKNALILRYDMENRNRRDAAIRQLDSVLHNYPAEYRDEIRASMIAGQFAHPDGAYEAAKGRRADKEREEFERLKKENEELRKDKEALQAGRVGTGGVPVHETARPGVTTMKESDLINTINRIEAESALLKGEAKIKKRNEAITLMGKRDRGEIKILYGQ